MPEDFTPDSPEMRTALNATREPSYAAEVASADVDAAWTRAQAVLDVLEIRGVTHRRTWISPRAVAAIAAVLVLTLGVTLAQVRSRVGGTAGRTYATLAGQRLSVTLMDGTQIVLAPDSRLTVPVAYSDGDRTTQLEGEAYFTVVHNAAHPFSVRTGQTTITDVGTVFDVRAYVDDRDMRVAVAEGRVSLGMPAGAVANRPYNMALVAGDILTITGKDMVMVHGADIGANTAWVQGRLVFQDVPLSQVVRDLARAYDLTITVADSTLLTRHVTASFTQEPIDEILSAIALPVGAEAERSGHRVVIKRRVSSSTLPKPPMSATPLRTAQSVNPHE